MGKTAGIRRRLSGGRLRLSYVPWRMYTQLLRASRTGRAYAHLRPRGA